MADLKFIGAVAIMVACFAVIYPRFMHPLFLRAFGLNDAPKQEKEGMAHPPGFNNPGHPHQQKKGADEMRRHMRAGPHPGLRAAAEMQKQQAQQGSGRGMMGVVLPMYAIGIVLYLVYTLFKVFNKSKGSHDQHRSSSSSMYRDQRGPYGRRGVRQDRMGFPMDYDGSDDVRSFLSDQQRRQELEDLLTKVDDKNVSTEEMRVLQRRLEETEAQMSRILQAMQSVQTNVDSMNPPQQEDQAENDKSENQAAKNYEEESRDENAEADRKSAGDNAGSRTSVNSASAPADKKLSGEEDDNGQDNLKDEGVDKNEKDKDDDDDTHLEEPCVEAGYYSEEKDSDDDEVGQDDERDSTRDEDACEDHESDTQESSLQQQHKSKPESEQ